jgi:hypothetical protein
MFDFKLANLFIHFVEQVNFEVGVFALYPVVVALHVIIFIQIDLYIRNRKVESKRAIPRSAVSRTY